MPKTYLEHRVLSGINYSATAHTLTIFSFLTDWASLCSMTRQHLTQPIEIHKDNVHGKLTGLKTYRKGDPKRTVKSKSVMGPQLSQRR